MIFLKEKSRSQGSEGTEGSQFSFPLPKREREVDSSRSVLRCARPICDGTARQRGVRSNRPHT